MQNYVTNQVVSCLSDARARTATNTQTHTTRAEMATSTSRKKNSGTNAGASARARDNERPLVEDIRLLGRILGDVIREQEGVAAFDLVERIRKLSVAFRRDADQEADRALKTLLKTLSGEQA